MSKYLLASLLGFVIATSSALAEVQSPIYTDDIGRAHFLGRGGYSSVRSVQMGEAYSGAVNEAVDKYTNVKNESAKKAEEVERNIETAKDTLEQAETDITKVIKEAKELPVARQKATFTSEKRQMDPSAPYGYGNTYIPAGVNESKTLYTDDLGRLHFFGKSNKTTEIIEQK